MPLSQNSTHVLKNTVQWKNGKTSNATFVLFVVLLLPQGQSECESIALYKKDTNQTGNTRNRNFCCGFCFFGQFACNVEQGACPFAFSTKSAYKRRFFVVPAYILQGKKSLTVVLPLFDLATISRIPQRTVDIKLVNVLLHVSVGHCTSTRHEQNRLPHLYCVRPAR